MRFVGCHSLTGFCPCSKKIKGKGKAGKGAAKKAKKGSLAKGEEAAVDNQDRVGPDNRDEQETRPEAEIEEI